MNVSLDDISGEALLTHYFRKILRYHMYLYKFTPLVSSPLSELILALGTYRPKDLCQDLHPFPSMSAVEEWKGMWSSMGKLGSTVYLL